MKRKEGSNVDDKPHNLLSQCTYFHHEAGSSLDYSIAVRNKSQTFSELK